LLLKAYTPTIISSEYKNPFKINFSRKQYDSFKSYFDVDLIHSLILSCFESQLDIKQVNWDEREPIDDDINILRQFEYFYNEDLYNLKEANKN